MKYIETNPHIKRLVTEINTGRWRDILIKLNREDISVKFECMPQNEIMETLYQLIDEPIDFTVEISGEMTHLYCISSWIHAFEILKLPKSLKALENASGASAIIPHALEMYTNGVGNYMTANLNKMLSKELIRKTNTLKIDIRVIEDNAVNLKKYVKPESFEIVTFQNAINDILQTIIADKKGIDTIKNNWWDIFPELIQGVTEYYRKGELRDIAYDDFISLMKVSSDLLKKGGYMIFNLVVHQYDIDQGLPRELYSSYIHLAKDWIGSSGLKLKANGFEDFDSRRWLFLKKI